MGIKKPVDRLPKNILRLYHDVVEDVLPTVMPSFIPTIIESTITTSQINTTGNHTLSLGDAGKSICGGNGTIFIPTNTTTPFPVVTNIFIVTEDDEFVIKAISNNITSVYHNGNAQAGDWIIPPRTMAKLCKIENEIWNIQGENIIRF